MSGPLNPKIESATRGLIEGKKENNIEKTIRNTRILLEIGVRPTTIFTILAMVAAVVAMGRA